MATYIYDGPVKHFGKQIDDKYTAVTTAPTEKKARNNLTYRYKMQKGFTSNAKISLPGEVKCVS